MTLAQNATFYRRVKELLDSWGWGKATELYPGWATRSNSGAVMLPQAVTVHHTGDRATATSYLVNPADRPQLRVLANVHITHGHKIRFICAGGASHGGYTHQPCYDRVVGGTAPLDRDLEPGPDSKTFSINKRTVGIEVDGAGGPKEWDDWTYRAAVAVSAACQLAGGWPIKGSPRVGAHKEHTRRKPGDPYAPMGKFRRDVLACFATPWGPIGEAVEVTLGSRLLSRDGNDSGADVVALINLLIAKGYALTNDGLFGPAVEAAVKDVQTKAGIAVDGVVGPDTLAALTSTSTTPTAEEPTVTTPPEYQFRFGQVAMQAERWGGPKTGTARRGTFLKEKMGCSLYALTEVPAADRDAIRAVLGSAWKVFATGYVAALWNSKKWKLKGSADVSFGTAYHGAVRVELQNLTNGQKLDVIALHLRPNASFATVAAAQVGRQNDLIKVVHLIRANVPTIVAGDFNTNATSALANAGMIRASEAVDTHDAEGVQRLDQVWVSKHLVVRKMSQVNPGGTSDHLAWLAQLTLPGSML